jgi:hypothetical protein
VIVGRGDSQENRLVLEGADIGLVAPGRIGDNRVIEGPRFAALIGGQPVAQTLIDRRAAAQQRDCLRWPAVVLEQRRFTARLKERIASTTGKSSKADGLR